MAWTYSDAPSTVQRDAVRLLIGDNDTTDQKLSDAEIAFFITEGGSTYPAAMAAVRALIARYAAQPSQKQVGDLSITYGERKESYEALLKQLEARTALVGGRILAGGISVADKDTVEEDTDRVAPAFRVGMLDFVDGSTST